MANQETQQLDNIIASRRALLVGGSALAALAFAPKAEAALAPASISDLDILNFALNLEYLEAQFYYYAAFGVPITTANNALITAAGGVNATTGIGVGAGTSQTGGGTVSIKANPKVPFATTAVASYAVETAVEEGKHVNFLRTALGASAVAQPNLDLNAAFNTLATAANGVTSTGGALPVPFDPFASDANFLIGAYVFEDVGVTAYHGAAPLISTTPTGKTYLQAAASILAVEAYHAGLIRSVINNLDPTNTLGYLGFTQRISALRSTLSRAALASAPNPDDVGIQPAVSYSLAGTTVPATTIVDADQANVIAFSRNTTQVLNIVTGGGALTANAKATGVFFPNGMNGAIA